MPEPPYFNVHMISSSMIESVQDVEAAIKTCTSLGWIEMAGDRYYTTVEGRTALCKAAENESTVTSMSVARHRSESLTGLREHTRKKQSVTSESPMTNAVLPKKQGGRDIRTQIEDALDLTFRIRKLAEKKGKSIEEIIMEELG